MAVFLPGLYLAFVLAAGTGCALVSGWIEYEVVKGLFSKNAEIIPVLIVVSAEVAKVYLVFLGKQYNKFEAYNSWDQWLGKILRTALVVFSATATLLFSFYNLYNPDYDEALEKNTQALVKRHNSKAETLLQSQTQELELKQQACLNEKEQIAEKYQSQIDHWLQKMQAEENIRDANGNFRGTDYINYEKHYNEAIQKRDAALSQIICNTDSLLAKHARERKALDAEHDQKIDKTTEELKHSTEAANQYIANTLKVIYGGNDYPPQAYLFCIALLSILISIALELIIWMTFTVLSVNHGNSFSSGFQEMQDREGLKEKLDNLSDYEDMVDDYIERKILSHKNKAEDFIEKLLKRFRDKL